MGSSGRIGINRDLNGLPNRGLPNHGMKDHGVRKAAAERPGEDLFVAMKAPGPLRVRGLAVANRRYRERGSGSARVLPAERGGRIRAGVARSARRIGPGLKDRESKPLKASGARVARLHGLRERMQVRARSATAGRSLAGNSRGSARTERAAARTNAAELAVRRQNRDRSAGAVLGAVQVNAHPRVLVREEQKALGADRAEGRQAGVPQAAVHLAAVQAGGVVQAAGVHPDHRGAIAEGGASSPSAPFSHRRGTVLAPLALA
jgi:hypothetical protein